MQTRQPSHRLGYFLCVSAFCVSWAAPVTASAQSAEKVAAYVQAFYDQTKSVTADFHQSYYYKLYKRYEKSKGTVVFQKPGKMRWDYDNPNGKKVLSDSKELRIYEPPDDGGRGQLIVQSMKKAQLPKAMSFLTGTSRLVDDFHFRLLDANQFKFGGYVLELRPKVKDPNVSRILFFVDGNPARRGVVHRVLILDHNGNRNKFIFTGMQFNRKVSDKTFAWKAPQGTRRINP